MEFKTKDGDNVKVEVTAEKASEVMTAIIDWCKQYNCFHGECIMQSDDPQTDAPWLIAHLVDDVIKFNVES